MDVRVSLASELTTLPRQRS